MDGNVEIVPFNKAIEAEQNGEYEKALTSYRYLAQQGEVEAIQRLAVLYFEGGIVDKDDTEAISWFRKGAAYNDKFCIFNLARCYADGIGVEKNDARAISFFLRSATLGDSDSQLVLAKYYLEEQNNFSLFKFWLEKALRQKNTFAFLYWQEKCKELQHKIDELVSEEEERKRRLIIEQNIAKRREIEKQLKNSYKDIARYIFKEKILNNKVHWFRGDR